MERVPTIGNMENNSVSYEVSYDEFVSRVGLLRPFDVDSDGSKEKELLESRLTAFGLTPCHSNGLFETYQLQELGRFVHEYPEYHIVTDIDDGEYSSLVNSVSFVNRMGYYLAHKETTPLLCTSELNEYED